MLTAPAVRSTPDAESRHRWECECDLRFRATVQSAWVVLRRQAASLLERTALGRFLFVAVAACNRTSARLYPVRGRTRGPTARFAPAVQSSGATAHVVPHSCGSPLHYAA